MTDVLSIKVIQHGNAFYAEAEHLPPFAITPDEWNTKKHGWKDDSLEKCLNGIVKAILAVRESDEDRPITDEDQGDFK